jgi:hypothetical protein
MGPICFSRSARDLRPRHFARGSVHPCTCGSRPAERRGDRDLFAARERWSFGVSVRSVHFIERATHDQQAKRFYADRALGGNRDYRRPDFLALTGRPGGPRGGTPEPVPQQSEAACTGRAQLPRRQQSVASVGHHDGR